VVRDDVQLHVLEDLVSHDGLEHLEKEGGKESIF
jgi:hypothetical protein